MDRPELGDELIDIQLMGLVIRATIGYQALKYQNPRSQDD
jgi:hypothetical protein